MPAGERTAAWVTWNHFFSSVRLLKSPRPFSCALDVAHILTVLNERAVFALVRIFSAELKRSQDCERGTQECVRHAIQATFSRIGFYRH
jgi:hypothetical protein